MTFQDIILALSRYWADQGCVVLAALRHRGRRGHLPPGDHAALAGTGHVAHRLRAAVSATRPTGATARTPTACSTTTSTRSSSSRRPDDVLDLYLDSLRAIGIEPAEHDVRLVEDDWESPTLGAWGLGWEVWLNGMEVTQFTYFQQVGGFECRPVPAEITYGLERLAMYIQGVDSVYDLDLVGRPRRPHLHLRRRLPAKRAAVLGVQLRGRRRRHAARPVHDLRGRVPSARSTPGYVLPAYDYVLKCSHAFNLLDARGAISVTERQGYILRVRALAKACCAAYLELVTPAEDGRRRQTPRCAGRG